jgi:hypothetical protein
MEYLEDNGLSYDLKSHWVRLHRWYDDTKHYIIGSCRVHSSNHQFGYREEK